MADFDRESMMEMFTFEMNQLLEQLEQNIIQGESGFSLAQINEIFRIMHTIKGSAAMMMFDNIANVAHVIEDLFYYLREGHHTGVDYSHLADLVLEGNDFIKEELSKIQDGSHTDGDGTNIISEIKSFLAQLKGGGSKTDTPAMQPKTATKVQKDTTKEKKESEKDGSLDISGMRKYKAVVTFTEGSEMENVRAYNLLHNFKNEITIIETVPDDLIEDSSIEIIRQEGFTLIFYSDQSEHELRDTLNQTIYLKDLYLTDITDSVETEQGDYNEFDVVMHFAEGCEMENIRAYTVVHNLNSLAENITHIPEDVIDDSSLEIIRKNGFKMKIKTNKSYDDIYNALASTLYLKDLVLTDKNKGSEVDYNMVADNNEKTVYKDEVDVKQNDANQAAAANGNGQAKKTSGQQHVINVNVSKLDQLLNLMGELVIAEAMVTQNPELDALELESFHKEARQLRKIINDVQDTVMSMRMVPLSTTFFKMNRIVRDMCKQLNKDVQLDIIGEDTEVDKNIIEHIADPLMHIIRNSIDHGIEKPEVRRNRGKSIKGKVVLEAKNSGGDVLIIVRDDGEGLNRDRIMEKAKNNGLLRKPENEYTDKEVHQFIFLPGFSTNDKVTSFSGRGVGMDVVSTNIELVGGTVIVDSTPGEGSTFILKIPLTLAIIEGMTIKMGGAKYTIPIISIKRSFKAKKEDIFTDPNGNEMITVRGECYNIVRLYEFFGVETDVKDFEEGIMIMLENGDQTICLFADDLIGEQQVVVKSMPKYIKKVRGISGCTLLGNGDISLIIDVAGFFDK